MKKSWLRSIASFSALLLSGCAPEEPEDELIKAKAIYLDGDVLFVNKEPFELRNCEFVLVMPSDRYRFKWVFPLAPSAETPPIPAEGFVNASREKFDASRYQPQAVLSYCTDAAGKRYSGGTVVR